MRLLFDQNLSPQLVNRLADLYPSSQHVSFIGLDRADDHALWKYANQNDFTIYPSFITLEKEKTTQLMKVLPHKQFGDR